jgi:hypothetical protein
MNRDVTGVLAFPEGFPKSLRRWRRRGPEEAEDHEVPDARHLRNCVGVGALDWSSMLVSITAPWFERRSRPIA